jgi:hypothetical protein
MIVLSPVIDLKAHPAREPTSQHLQAAPIHDEPELQCDMRSSVDLDQA